MQNLQTEPNVPESIPKGPEGLEDLINLEIDIEPYLPDVIVPAWSFMQDYPLLLVLVMFVIGYSVGKGLQWLLRFALTHAAKRTASILDDKLIQYLTAPVVQTTVILSLVAVEKAFGFSDTVDWYLVRLLFSLLVFFWGRAWFRATRLAISVLSERTGQTKVFQPRTRPLFEMSVKVILFGVLAWVFMALWGIDGTAWVASAGVIGIAVGFAAKDTLANLISGVSIIADAPYKLGDYIVLDTGERGVVTELGMRSTRLLTRDDVEISIPNAVMGNAKITNESGGPKVDHRIGIPVGAAYGTLPGKVIDVLEQVARDEGLILDNPPPRARMRAFGESSLDFELLGWIRHPELRGLVKHNLLIEIERRFREEGIQIPFPQRDVYLKTPGDEVKLPE
jgi:small-conductance mechanosensitive channel